MSTVERTTMRHRLAQWQLRFGWWLESGFALLALNLLHTRGLAAHGSVWPLNAVLVATGISQHPRMQRLFCGDSGTPPVARWLRMFVPVVLTTMAIYLTGWGPLLGIGFVVLASTMLEITGSRSWRPLAVYTILAAAGGQLGIALGWTYCYLPGTNAQAMGALGTFAAASAIRMLGLSTAAREREAAVRARVELALRASEEAARRNEERFRALVQDSCDVVAVTDIAGTISYVSSAVAHVMGYQPEEYIRVAGIELVHPDDRPASIAMMTALLSGASERRAEWRIRHADDTWHWHEVSARNLLDNPAVGGIMYSHRDITERKQYQERLAHEASHDALTGLVNRTALMEALTAACSPRRAGLSAVLFLDLNGFKHINDELGHEVGDQLLLATARALRESVLGADTVARLGGDEFAVVLSDIHTADNAAAVAARIIERLSQPVPAGGHLVQARASIGIALCPPGGILASEVLRRADVAMYRAKRDKTQSWKLYVEGMEDHRSDTAALADDLRDALARDELEVFYQPVIDLDTEQTVGMEALVRWQHPTRGWLPPLTFIPVAEDCGLIGALGAMVLRRATAHLVGWQRRWPDGPRLTLSVNLSPRQLERQTLVSEVREILTGSGVDPGDVTLELTESAAVDDPAVVSRLHALRELGLRIALDDFGTGYSSLRYLTELPVDVLKLDRCFVDRLDGTAQGAAVTDAVLRLAGVLNLEVIAEGVETVAQATELRQRGCRCVQGFLFAAPMDSAALDARLGRERAGDPDWAPARPGGSAPVVVPPRSAGPDPVRVPPVGKTVATSRRAGWPAAR